MRLIKLNLFLLSFFLLSSGLASAQVELFISVRDDCLGRGATDATLYSVDPDTAQSSPIGPIGFLGVTGLAFLPDGRMVASARGDGQPSSAILLEINPETGAGSLIGTIGESVDGQCGRAPDLSVHPVTGALYATGDDCSGTGGDSLQNVNPDTGVGTVIGTYSPFDGGGNGLAISSNGTFYVTPCCEDQLDTAALITVNPVTVSPTFIGNVNVGEDTFVNALAFHPITGDLYGTTIDQSDSDSIKSSKLVIIDPVTAEPTIVGDLPDCTDGLAFRISGPSNVPTLSEWGLISLALILGIMGYMILRRRNVTA